MKKYETIDDDACERAYLEICDGKIIQTMTSKIHKKNNYKNERIQ